MSARGCFGALCFGVVGCHVFRRNPQDAHVAWCRSVIALGDCDCFRVFFCVLKCDVGLNLCWEGEGATFLLDA